MNKNIILQCRHTETPGARLVWRSKEVVSVCDLRAVAQDEACGTINGHSPQFLFSTVQTYDAKSTN